MARVVQTEDEARWRATCCEALLEGFRDGARRAPNGDVVDAASISVTLAFENQRLADAFVDAWRRTRGLARIDRADFVGGLVRLRLTWPDGTSVESPATFPVKEGAAF